MQKMIDLRVLKAGGASWAANVNLAAFPLTRVYRQSTTETAASIKKKSVNQDPALGKYQGHIPKASCRSCSRQPPLKRISNSGCEVADSSASKGEH